MHARESTAAPATGGQAIGKRSANRSRLSGRRAQARVCLDPGDRSANQERGSLLPATVCLSVSVCSECVQRYPGLALTLLLAPTCVPALLSADCPDHRLPTAHRPPPHTMSSDKKAVVKNADMSEEMQDDAINTAIQALDKYNIEKDIAAFIKKEFDKKYNPTWHCIVGRNFGSYVTHETKHFIYFYLGQVAILLFKSG